MTGRTKALAVFTAAIVLTVLSAGLWGSPFGVDPAVEGTALGVVGVVGLAVARAFAAAGVVLGPLLRLALVPGALLALGYLAIRGLRRA